jgi:hypothetical protein
VSRARAGGGRGSVFEYGGRYRWAYVPSLLFLIVIALILAFAPELVWQNLDPVVRRNGILLAAALALGFAVALGARWASPFRFTLEQDALLIEPLFGGGRRVPYGEIREVSVLPKSFMRGVPEVELRPVSGRPITIRTDIGGYAQLEKGLRRRLAPALQAQWKEERANEAPDSGRRR